MIHRMRRPANETAIRRARKDAIFRHLEAICRAPRRIEPEFVQMFRELGDLGRKHEGSTDPDALDEILLAADLLLGRLLAAGYSADVA